MIVIYRDSYGGVHACNQSQRIKGIVLGVKIDDSYYGEMNQQVKDLLVSNQVNDVRAIRARLGLSQAEFAKLVGATAASVSYWERGISSPNPMHAQKISEIRT